MAPNAPGSIDVVELRRQPWRRGRHRELRTAFGAGPGRIYRRRCQGFNALPGGTARTPDYEFATPTEKCTADDRTYPFRRRALRVPRADEHVVVDDAEVPGDPPARTSLAQSLLAGAVPHPGKRTSIDDAVSTAACDAGQHCSGRS